MNVVWFKRDLRLTDHAPLTAAIDRDEPLILLYVVEPELTADPHYRGRHWHFITQSLETMNEQLAATGGRIEILEGDTVSILKALHSEEAIGTLFSYEETGLGVTFQRDRDVARFCESERINWKEFQTNGAQRGRRDRRGWNRAWHAVMSDAQTHIAPGRIVAQLKPLPPTLESARCNRLARWRQEKPEFQRGGSAMAQQALHQFLTERAGSYQRFISKPERSRAHCSRLSPYLAWGNISLRQVYQDLKQRQSEGGWGGLSAFESRLSRAPTP